MIYMGNKVTTTDRLLDPMGLKPSIYELDPNQAERETRYPYDRTYQTIPVNMALAEQRQRNNATMVLAQDGYPVPPQQAEYRDMSGSRPPAPSRQAWTSGPTFRHFRRRRAFREPNGRPTQRDYSVGDTYYRPKPIEQERHEAMRTYTRYATQGPPVRGTW